MTVVEPYDGSLPSVPAGGSTTCCGVFTDRQMETLYQRFRAEYQSHGAVFFIVQFICLNCAAILQSALHYQSAQLPHLVLMAVLLCINLALFVCFYRIR